MKLNPLSAIGSQPAINKFQQISPRFSAISFPIQIPGVKSEDKSFQKLVLISSFLLTMVGNWALFSVAQKDIELGKQAANKEPLALSMAKIKQSSTELHELLDRLPNPTNIDKAFLCEQVMRHYQTINREMAKNHIKSTLNTDLLDYAQLDPALKKEARDLLLQVKTAHNALQTANYFKHFVKSMVIAKKITEKQGQDYLMAYDDFQNNMIRYHHQTLGMRVPNVYKKVEMVSLIILIGSLLVLTLPKRQLAVGHENQLEAPLDAATI